jgi:hypothetical protein
MPPRISVVINTYNRARSLESTIKSLYHLEYADFEVIVVNGPSDDGTGDVLRKHAGDIKVLDCPERNLSVSRNIGICAARGEIVAFIDDDAVPEAEWLEQVAAGYDSDEVGGVGGLVFDHTGRGLQYKYSSCSRLGNPKWDHQEPASYMNFPGSYSIPYLQGTNATFRRDVLLEVGGFDEEYEFYLDETDVCLRVVDRGYVIKQLDNAYVHHKFAPSSIRNEHKVTRNKYPIVKNKLYFSIRNGLGWNNTSFNDLIVDAGRFIENHGRDVMFHVNGGRLSPDDLALYWQDVDRAWKDGIVRGLRGDRELIDDNKLRKYKMPYMRFNTLGRVHDRLVVCFLSQDLPPEHNGGIARFTFDLAHGVARLGHQVHVITRGKGHDTVDFEDGIWVHRIVPGDRDFDDAPREMHVYRKNLNYSLSAYEEVRKINEHRKVDVVEAPIWDAEGLHCLQDGGFKTVVSLETTVRIAIESYPEWAESPDIQKVVETEKRMLETAPGFHAISRGIVSTVQDAYGLKIPEDKIGLVPLGVKDESVRYRKRRSDDDVRVLFVGRHEKRKGVDVLLEVIPGLCDSHPKAMFVLVGDNAIPNEKGSTFMKDFLDGNAGAPFLDRVEFKGRLSDEEMYQEYADCDVFVAPSRYESFGLIFLEAMLFSKPVVGCDAGGMAEIIKHGENGFLARPGDAATLRDYLDALIADPAMRGAFGRRSRQIYEDGFTVEKMSEGIVTFFRKMVGART